VGRDASNNEPPIRGTGMVAPAVARLARTVVPLLLIAAAAAGCVPEVREAAQIVILPEQRTIDYSDPAELPPARVPDSPPPRTVTDPRPETTDWPLSLDDAIRISLERAGIIRVLGAPAANSGQTIYDTAIVNTTIDQERARFDPVLTQRNQWDRSNVPFAAFDPLNPFESIIASTPSDSYSSQLGVTKTNVLGGQWALTWNATNTRVTEPGLPLNPQTPSSVSLSYTQPLLQGAGFNVNMAPIVIARLSTERSYFQYKDAVQEMVRGVIQGYWNLVQARTDLLARRIQLDQSDFALNVAKARVEAKLANKADEAQARVTYNQFHAAVVAAEANVLTQEGALRGILYLPPEDGRRIVPTSVPTSQRLRPDWEKVVRLAEQRRPDIVERKLIVEADRQQLLQARNQALPQLNASAMYRWNGLSGEMPNGEHLATRPGEFTDWTVGVTFSVPLGLRQGRAAVRQQRLLIARDEENVAEVVHEALHDLAATVRDLDAAYEQYLILKDAREAAAINLDYQRAQFKEGRVPFLNVLQAINDFGSVVSSEAAQLLAYNVTLAAVERQTGTILETHGLVFNEERFRAAGPLPCRDRDYPAALVPSGSPHRYPDTGKPSEDAFDLKQPAPPREQPEIVLPPPRVLP
jgi:outer membrane protein TolC